VIAIARVGAIVYEGHRTISFLILRPQFALGPFSFQNCCYRGSPAHDLARASVVGKRTLKQLPECPRAGDDFWLGPPPVLEFSEKLTFEPDLNSGARTV
jgi:hypothetical protein